MLFALIAIDRPAIEIGFVFIDNERWFILAAEWVLKVAGVAISISWKFREEYFGEPSGFGSGASFRQRHSNVIGASRAVDIIL